MRQPLPRPVPVLRTGRLKRAANVPGPASAPSCYESALLTIQHWTLSWFQPLCLLKVHQPRSTIVRLPLSLSVDGRVCFWSRNVFIYRGFLNKTLHHVNFRCFSEFIVAEEGRTRCREVEEATLDGISGSQGSNPDSPSPPSWLSGLGQVT